MMDFLKKNLKKQSAFSLAEALVVMLIVSIISLAALPVVTRKNSRNIANNQFHGKWVCAYNQATGRYIQGSSSGANVEPNFAEVDECEFPFIPKGVTFLNVSVRGGGGGGSASAAVPWERMNINLHAGQIVATEGDYNVNLRLQSDFTESTPTDSATHNFFHVRYAQFNDRLNANASPLIYNRLDTDNSHRSTALAQGGDLAERSDNTVRLCTGNNYTSFMKYNRNGNRDFDFAFTDRSAREDRRLYAIFESDDSFADYSSPDNRVVAHSNNQFYVDVLSIGSDKYNELLSKLYALASGTGNDFVIQEHTDASGVKSITAYVPGLYMTSRYNDLSGLANYTEEALAACGPRGELRKYSDLKLSCRNYCNKLVNSYSGGSETANVVSATRNSCKINGEFIQFSGVGLNESCVQVFDGNGHQLVMPRQLSMSRTTDWTKDERTRLGGYNRSNIQNIMINFSAKLHMRPGESIFIRRETQPERNIYFGTGNMFIQRVKDPDKIQVIWNRVGGGQVVLAQLQDARTPYYTFNFSEGTVIHRYNNMYRNIAGYYDTYGLNQLSAVQPIPNPQYSRLVTPNVVSTATDPTRDNFIQIDEHEFKYYRGCPGGPADNTSGAQIRANYGQKYSFYVGKGGSGAKVSVDGRMESEAQPGEETIFEHITASGGAAGSYAACGRFGWTTGVQLPAETPIVNGIYPGRGGTAGGLSFPNNRPLRDKRLDAANDTAPLDRWRYQSGGDGEGGMIEVTW